MLLQIVLSTFPLLSQSITVNTTNGPVIGTQVNDLNVFIGIPFAKPPIDQLRFASPEAPDSWTDPLELDVNNTIRCLQQNESYHDHPPTEDCLYLNIWTPSDAEYMNTSYQVMVWIHGGSFERGSISDSVTDPTTIMEETGDIIVVAINYRLGILGWLYDNTYGTGVEGNLGFEDQIMAIEWVHNNIAYFGGDETNINLWGLSAGAQCVGLHLLFHPQYIASGIMQSPLYANEDKTPDSWNNIASTFNELVGCDSDNIEEKATLLLECWRSVDADDILSAQLDASIRGTELIPFSPTVDTEILPDQPMTAFQEIETAPFLIGMVKDEFYNYYQADLVDSIYDNYLGAQITLNLFLQNYTVTKAAFDFYGVTATNSITGTYVLDTIVMLNDAILCATDYLMERLPNSDGKYYYRMDTVNEEVYEGWIGDQNAECWSRMCHGMDFMYTHRPHEFADYFDDQVVELSEVVQSYWTNFAKYHDPNGDNLVEWPQYNQCWNLDLDNQLKFDETASPYQVSHTATCDFWDSVGYTRPYNNPSTLASEIIPSSTSAECIGNSSDIETTTEEDTGDGASRTGYQSYRVLSATFVVVVTCFCLHSV